MNEILGSAIEDMPELEFDCTCGKKHRVYIKNIEIGSGNLAVIAHLCAYFGREKIFLLADTNTYAVLGRKVKKLLESEGFNLSTYVLSDEDIFSSEKSAFALLFSKVPEDARLILAVGSGTVNRFAGMLSARLRLPYSIFCTAPSIDDFTLSFPPAHQGHQAGISVFPRSIIADTVVLKNAPMPLLQAGFGSVLCKLTSLTDWVLARERNGEYYCRTTVSFLRKTVKKTLSHADGIAAREEEAIHSLMETLALSGVAVGLAGSTRPSYGSEHAIAGVWESEAPQCPLHGGTLGVAAVVAASLYEMMGDRVPSACKLSKPEEIAALLRRTGACDNPKSLGISRESFRESISIAKNACPYFTVLQLASSYGLLEKFADELTRRFYD